MPFPKGTLRGPSSNVPYPASWGFFLFHLGNFAPLSDATNPRNYLKLIASGDVDESVLHRRAL